jgi:beta-N-acetylhexosaminidase
MVTLSDKVGQLFICRAPDNLEDIENFVREGIGGFSLGKGGEIISKEQEILEGNTRESLKSFIKQVRDFSRKHRKTPLFFAIDGEGGEYFNRLKSISDYKSPRFYGRKFEEYNDIEFFRKEVTRFVQLMNYIGLNINFAPVIDTAQKGYRGYMAESGTEIRNGLITSELHANNRAYSDKMQTVIKLGLTAMRIFQERKIIPVLKHFPSYGILKPNENPHVVLPDSDLPGTEILRHVTPFREAIKQGCYAVMTGHVITSLDRERPASLSVKVNRFLRKLGFSGLAVSDELFMGAIQQFYSKTDTSLPLDALQANDILLTSHPEHFLDMKNSIMDAAKNKTTMQRIDEAYKKILRYKRILKIL